jgi:hypothetical protein
VRSTARDRRLAALRRTSRRSRTFPCLVYHEARNVRHLIRAEVANGVCTLDCAHPFAESLRSIRCGNFVGYPAFESRFNEPIDAGLAR